MTVKTQQFCYNLLLLGYMFRLLRFIIRPSNELTQDYLNILVLTDIFFYHLVFETRQNVFLKTDAN